MSSQHAYKMETREPFIFAAPIKVPEIALDLNYETKWVNPEQKNSEILNLFNKNPNLLGLAVVEDGYPVGVISRTAYFSRFARPFARELHLKRPCREFCRQDVLRVDGAVKIEDLGSQVAESGNDALQDGFVVTSEGRFVGLCDGVTLIRALSDIHVDQHRQLLSGIEYASTIQTAMMVDSRATLARTFGPDHKVKWRPRDAVGGDCFFATQINDGVLMAAIDCTGHGVPGALLTSIALSETNRLATDPDLCRSPAAMIQGLNRRMKASLQQHDASDLENASADDGMDAVFVFHDTIDETVRIASAKLPVFLIRSNGCLETLKGDRKGIGYRDTPVDFEWTEVTVPVSDIRRMIVATDGLCDQIGGPKGIAFGWNRIREAIERHATSTVEGQIDGIWDAFVTYQGDEVRRDDVTVIGLDFSKFQRADAE